MIAAMVEVSSEFGAGRATVAHVVARSGVSRRTFYELFEDRDDCFVAAFDQAVERASVSVASAYLAAGGWRARMRAGLGALLEFLDDEPGLGALCIVDVLAGGPVALERRARVVELLVDAVDEGRAEAKGSLRPTRMTAEGVVGAVLAVLYARLEGDDGSPKTGLLSALMGMIVLPYLGSAAAAREIARPAPSTRRPAHAGGDPLRDLDMRLTYRTVRVLLAIASQPGASNRQVADAAEVTDQGQISKLLARLEHLGLTENHGAGAARGGPNVWHLTPRGQKIQHIIRQQAVADTAS